jgi:hypothetical protein
MNYLERKNDLKLNILHSLVLSHDALAKILQHTAARYGTSTEPGDEEINDTVRKLLRYQEILTKKMLSIQLCNTKNGRPKSPWLHPNMQIKIKK